jgi:hypothetical protein
VCGVGFSLVSLGCVLLFDFLCFLVGELRRIRRKSFFSFFGIFFGFLLEFGTADDGIGLRLFLRFFVFGLGKIRGQCGNLVFAQFRFAADRSCCFAIFFLRRRGSLLYGR